MKVLIPSALRSYTNQANSEAEGATLAEALLEHESLDHDEILKVDVATRQATPITKGDHALAGWNFAEDAGLHVFTRNTADRPSEIYTLSSAANASMTRVTSRRISSRIGAYCAWRLRSGTVILVVVLILWEELSV